MTGQAQQNIRRIRELASEGLTRREIAAAIGIGYEYVATLVSCAGIAVSRETDRKIAKIKLLASKGRTRQQIADEIGISYQCVTLLGKRNSVKFVRSGLKTKPDHREYKMAALYTSGKTLNEIGQEFNLTRERVRQLLTKYFGIGWQDGGNHKRAIDKREKFEARRNAKSLKRWGCSWSDYAKLRALGKPTRAFTSQRRNAMERGIPWELSLWQWWSIWQESGQWVSRGRGTGYQMCRRGDQGPYSVDNVYIATGAKNIQDYWADVKSGARTRQISIRQLNSSPERSKASIRAATERYRQTPKFKLRYQLRRQGLPKEQRDAIVAERFGASS